MQFLVLILLTAFFSSLHAQPYSIVEGNTTFALDFYKALSAQGAGNVFVSPFSLSCALAMT
jgi:serine protease inhibitor